MNAIKKLLGLLWMIIAPLSVLLMFIQAAEKIKLASVKSMEQMKTSMMSAGLHTGMSQQEMADLLAYLDGLKRK